MLILAYVGPDTLMPVATALAAAMGFLIMTGHRVLAAFRGGWRRLRGRFTR